MMRQPGQSAKRERGEAQPADSRSSPLAFAPPATDDLDLTALLGAKGYHDDVALVQFAAWADAYGLFGFLAARESATTDEVVGGTMLSEPGVDAIAGVLSSIGILLRSAQRLALSPLAREYLAPGGPYYMGASLYVSCSAAIPSVFLKPDTGSPHAAASDQYGRSHRRNRPFFLRMAGKSVPGPARAKPRKLTQIAKRLEGWEFGGRRILENQHSRNLPAATTAAHLPLFDGMECVVDMAGGTGPFSIPLSQLHPDIHVILADLPQALPGARSFLKRFEAERIELIGMDVFSESWPIPRCDGIFFGNFMHGFTDDRCTDLARRSFDKLRPGGRIMVHELIWNENRDGPLKTALFNVTMREFGGRQRTEAEIHVILERAGFTDLVTLPTSGGFVVVCGTRPG